MKTIISSLLLLGAASFAANAAVEVKNTKELDNNKVYLIMRNSISASLGRGYAYVDGTGTKAHLYTATAAKADTTDVNAHFSLHYSPREKAYYLYSLGAEKFIGGGKNHIAELSATAVDCNPMYSDLAAGWLLDCGGYLLAAVSDEDGFAMFNDEYNAGRAKAKGTHFVISEKHGATITKEQSDAIETKIAESRESALKTYRTFLTKAQKVIGTGDLANYIGEYDLDELTYALDHADDYSLAEIEEIYQRTLVSRFPLGNTYYRIHNGVRPGTRATNYMATTTDGALRVRTLEAPAFGSATEGYSDDLCLFRFFPVDGDRTQMRMQAAAFYQYLAGGANQEEVRLTSSADDATVYELTAHIVNGRVFRFTLPSKESYLSVTSAPECKVWGYSTLETANQWFIEQVNTISVPVDANGYATVCLPCGVALPDGVKAYTVTDVADGKAYVEELQSPIHLSTPWIIKAAAGAGTVELPIEDNRNWTRSAMAGNMRATASTPGRYVPTFSASGISFTYQPESDEPSMPGSCYIVSDDQGPLTTVMGANPNSGIEEITADEAAGRELYDLVGRRVSGTPRAGIYINAATKKTIRVNP